MNINPTIFGKVAVLLGGMSNEREVSLISGSNVLTALKKCGVNAYAIDVGFDLAEQLLATKPDRVFNALHGAYGEDGVVQGLLDMMKIPYTGSGVEASALAMNKHISKLIWRAHGLPVLLEIIVKNKTQLDQVRDEFVDVHGLPLCVKPMSGGSTIGVSKVIEVNQLYDAFQVAKMKHDSVLIEPWIEGREFTVGILGNETLPVLEIIPKEGYYDYAAKYTNVETTKFVHAIDLSKEIYSKMQEIALKAFNYLGCRHLGRADFLMNKNGDVWLLEMNIIPGLTSHSLVPQMAALNGMDFETLICRILEFTLGNSTNLVMNH